MNWKLKAEKILTSLQQDAVANEKLNQIELKKLGIKKDIISDQQYWNGYLDALDNFKKEVKKVY